MSDSKEEDKKKKSKVRAFYKSLLKACDKYDELKESFDEIYNPINEQYQELAKIPGLIPMSSQTVIQNAFDQVDEITGIADDFCSTLRGEFEPILERLEISIQEILDEIAIEKGQQPSNTLNSNAQTLTTQIMSKKIIAAIITGLAIVSTGGIYASLDMDVDTPQISFPENGSLINDNNVEFQWQIISDQSGIDYYIIELFQEDINSLSFTEQVKSSQYRGEELDNGAYSWRVKAVDNAGNQGSFSEKSFFSIKVLDPPVAKITTETNNVKIGQAIHFGGISSIDNDGFLDKYSWDFDDGTKVNGGSVSHVFSAAGSYSVKLTVTDNDGQTDTSSTIIHVNSLDIPVAVIKADTTMVDIGKDIQFDGESSFDVDGRIVSHYWIFGDDAISNEVNPSHTYHNPGDYKVSLQVTDDDGQTDNALFEVIVQTTPPPSPTIHTPENSELLEIDLLDKSVLVNFNWSDVHDIDGISYFEMILNDQILSNIDKTSHSMLLDEGKYKWSVRAVDTFGAKSSFAQSHNFIVEKYVPPPPLWTMAKLTWSSDVYEYYENTGHITVEDNDINDPDLVEEVSVKITSKYNPTGFSITLVETGTDTGIFEGNVDFTDLYDYLDSCHVETITAFYVDNRLPLEHIPSRIIPENTNKKTDCLA